MDKSAEDSAPTSDMADKQLEQPAKSPGSVSQHTGVSEASDATPATPKVPPEPAPDAFKTEERINTENSVRAEESQPSGGILESNGVPVKAEPKSSASTSSKRPVHARVRKPSQKAVDVAEQPKVQKRRRKPAKMVKLKYFNAEPLPQFEPIQFRDEASQQAFWIRVALREFLWRFNKLVQPGTRHYATINDPTQTWSDVLYKTVIAQLLHVILNDHYPIFPFTKQYYQAIQACQPSSAEIWAHLLEFLQRADPYVYKSEQLNGELQRLDLVRRLTVLCTGTETIRLTVTSDVDELKFVVSGNNEELKKLEKHWKETQKKLQSLKKVGPDVYKAKLEAARAQSDQRVWRVHQDTFQKQKKYNLRTQPIGEDNLGNVYWALQQKSRDMAAWGSWIICEMRYDPESLRLFAEKLPKDVDHVLESRAQAPPRKKKKTADTSNPPQSSEQSQSTTGDHATEQQNMQGSSHSVNEVQNQEEFPSKAAGLNTKPENGTASSSGKPSEDPPKKRRYPKVKIDMPKPNPQLYYVAGGENLSKLARWVGGQGSKQLAEKIELLSMYVDE